MKKIILDADEKDILDSYERGEWKSVKDPKAEIKKLSEYAKNTLQKDKRINIRISSKDLDQVQVIAAQEGILTSEVNTVGICTRLCRIREIVPVHLCRDLCRKPLLPAICVVANKFFFLGVLDQLTWQL